VRNRSLLVFTAVLSTGVMTASACGSRSGGSTDSDGKKTVVIGVDAPLTGPMSAVGLGIRNSVDLATKNANSGNEVPGVTFKIKALDDQAQPSTGQQNATQLVADKSVLGVVGPYNSSVAQSMQKVFDVASLTEVSPANTNPTLTQGPNWKNGPKTRPFHSYVRTATTDALQGPFGARYAFTRAHLRRVFLIDDKLTYGVGLVGTFKPQFTQLGGQVVGQDHVATGQKDFAAVVARVKQSHADFVYYGGQYPEGAPLAAQLRTGANIPVMGGDGLFDPTFIKLAGAARATGDMTSSVGAPLETLKTAKKFLSGYQTAGYKEPYAAYGGYSYDAAWAIIQAVKAVVSANNGKLPDDARAKILAAMSKVSFKGVTGKVAFDEFGDTVNKQLTLYTVKGGQWKATSTGTIAH
jgi:branched-chain amino acid transport system substrate-binding protein